MRQYPDLGSASDWLKQISVTAQPIRSTMLIWVVACLWYGISAGIPQASFCGKISDDFAKYWLFSLTTLDVRYHE